MRLTVLIVLPLLSACDPAAIADFDIHPEPGRFTIDSSFLSQAISLGRDFAQRYQLTSLNRKDCPGVAYYADDTARGRHVGLNLCLAPVRTEYRFSVTEIITDSWGTKRVCVKRRAG